MHLHVRRLARPPTGSSRATSSGSSTLMCRAGCGASRGRAGEDRGELRVDVSRRDALTRIGLWRARSSWRSPSVSARTANFVAAYTPESGPGTRWPAIDDTCTMCPATLPPLHVLDGLARRDAEPEHVHLEHLAPQRRSAPDESGARATEARRCSPARRRRRSARARGRTGATTSSSTRMSVAATATCAPLDSSSAARPRSRSSRRAASIDARARRRERARRRHADAARRAGDHDASSVETRHARPHRSA